MTDVVCIGCYKFECTTIPAPGAGWRQIAAATPDSSIVVPFNWYGSMVDTSRAADCRPYKTFVPYESIFNVSIAVWRPENAKNDNLSVSKKPTSGNRRHRSVRHGGGQLAYLLVAAVSGGEKAGGLGLQLVVCQQIPLFVPGGKAG